MERRGTSAAVLLGLLGLLFCTVAPAASKVKQEHRTAFFGEDIHIVVPGGNLGEVVFKPRTNGTGEEFVMKAGRVVAPQAYRNTLGHLVLEDVQERNEGLYIIRNANTSAVVKHLVLIVRDCALEQVVKYGESYYIHLTRINTPITLQFRPGMLQVNQTVIQPATEAPLVLLYNRTQVMVEEYEGRLSVSDKRVALHSVRMTDEGSFTVLDRDGKIKMRSCLNVREHQDFVKLTYGHNLRMKLYLHHSNLNIVYRPKWDNVDRPVVEQGVPVAPLDPLLEGRLTVEGSELLMKKVLVSDAGVFRVTDLAGFAVAHVYVQVEPYKLPALTVAILALLGLIAFMLLVCLLSCIYKVHKRNEKNRKLTLLAQQSGKGDGDAFRQVVHEAYSRFTEESLTQSVCDKPSESTEVTIKGLEVSKPGRYQALNSDNFLEMSDSGVEFTNSGLPLDSDTDGGTTYASHKPLLIASSPAAVTTGGRSNSLEATTFLDGELSAGHTPDSVVSASPASNPRSASAPTPDGSPRAAASPGAPPRGAEESDSAKANGTLENADVASKEESVRST